VLARGLGYLIGALSRCRPEGWQAHAAGYQCPGSGRLIDPHQMYASLGVLCSLREGRCRRRFLDGASTSSPDHICGSPIRVRWVVEVDDRSFFPASLHWCRKNYFRNSFARRGSGRRRLIGDCWRTRLTDHRAVAAQGLFWSVRLVAFLPYPRNCHDPAPLAWRRSPNHQTQDLGKPFSVPVPFSGQAPGSGPRASLCRRAACGRSASSVLCLCNHRLGAKK